MFSRNRPSDLLPANPSFSNHCSPLPSLFSGKVPSVSLSVRASDRQTRECENRFPTSCSSPILTAACQLPVDQSVRQMKREISNFPAIGSKSARAFDQRTRLGDPAFQKFGETREEGRDAAAAAAGEGFPYFIPPMRCRPSVGRSVRDSEQSSVA